MKIDNEIKAKMFSSELDSITISGCTPGAAVELSISDDDYQYVMFTLSLYADAYGKIQISQFAELLNDSLNGSPSTVGIGDLASIWVIPTTIAPKMPAEEYLKGYPMTTVRGPKTCFAGSRQYFPYYSTTGAYQVKRTVFLREATLEQTVSYDNVDGARISADYFVAENIIREKGYSADCYRVKTEKMLKGGYRAEMLFDYIPRPFGGKTFYFLNSFFQKESMPIASIERSSKPKHSFAKIGGKMVNYQVKDDTTFEITSVPLRDGEIEMAADFLRSKSVVSEEGIEYVVKDGQLKVASNAEEMWQVKATIQQVDELQHFDGHRPKLFDDTFDQTFD